MNELMNKVKAYTDINQSKMLVKILPIDSADMRYGYIAPYDYSDRKYDGGYDKIPYPKDLSDKIQLVEEYASELPCWSLAALLSILKQPCLSKNSWGTWLIREWGLFSYPVDTANSDPIDACYNLIIKLHEQKLI